jgi:hypothetical protein
MRHLAIVLSLSVLHGCATSVAMSGSALSGGGDTTSARGCRIEDPCSEGGGGGGGGGGGLVALGVGAAALGIGVGALIYHIARSRPADPRPRS